MKISRIVIIIVVIIVIGVVALFAYEAVSTSSTTSTTVWYTAANYPLQLVLSFGVGGQQCINSTGYIYCIGGLDVNFAPRSEVYSSSLLSSSAANITSWNGDANSYPTNIQAQSCVAYSGYAYCVGGSYDEYQDDVASSYFTPIGSTGTLGTWDNTTAYPVPTDSQYCAASSGYIYCVGGNNETDGLNDTATASNSVYYAPLSSAGIGNWTHSTAYPANLYFPSCFASNGFMYCLGGTNINDKVQSSVYYASLSSSGVGPWTQTTSYPMSLVGQSCVLSSGYIYCVGGQENNQNTYTNAVYYAPVSSSGIGTWKAATNYPQAVETTCTLSSNYIYCVGGFNGSSAGETDSTYYASLSSLS